MAKFHFFDIECLTNIFTLTNYYPEENKVEQFYLADPALTKDLQAEANLKKTLTSRVNLRNPNFHPNYEIKMVNGKLMPGSGSVELYDLSKPESNIKLAHEFGLSSADDSADPTDVTNFYPNSFRLTADTDKDNGTGNWKRLPVMQRYLKKLSKRNNLHEFTLNKTLQDYSMLHYHEYSEDRDPYILGYNSDNYDLTLLSMYFEDTFNEVQHPDRSSSVDLFSVNGTGFHYFKINPPKPETLRKLNNIMFSSKYSDNMPSILYNAPEGINYKFAFRIRKNMLRSGRHLDVARLNEKMSKIGLKRILGQSGFQILESSKLKPGTDHIENADQFYELLAYNASDCINLGALFFNPKDQYYVSQFNLKKSMLKTYPMIVYDKQKDKYAANIAPNTVKKNRMKIDSSSAQIATNVVCPYGYLNDIPAVSFNYPEARKAVEVKINQFNVLNQTRAFFQKRVYEPALKLNKKAALKAKQQFDRVMKFYSFIQGKNFNDSVHYYSHQLAKSNPAIKDELEHLKPEVFTEIFNCFNTFDLLAISHFKKISISYQIGWQNHIDFSNEFIKANHIVNKARGTVQHVHANELLDFISKQIKNNTLTNDESILAKKILTDFKRSGLTNLNAQDVYESMSTNDNINASNEQSLEYSIWRQNVNKFLHQYFTDYDLTLETYDNAFAHNWDMAKIIENGKPMIAKTLQPYTSQDLPVDNYCLPFFNIDGTASRGYAVFSIGGIHGAEYNYDLYQKDIKAAKAADQNQGQLSLFSDNTDINTKTIKLPKLFKANKKGAYKLNDRYTYTSFDYANHEDFSSYYPSLCRMLNVYWNDGIGKDIYGEVYDRKEKLGIMMNDPKYTPEQRAYYKDQRQGTKLILNSTTGKGDSHGQNSPIQMNNNIVSMRLIGQMFTWRIGQAQTLAGAKVISTNTDGLYTVMDDLKLNDKILADEVKEIHVRIDPERLYLISKDANNRIESDAKTLKINTPSGGNLAAFNGPTPTKSLAHPAIVDRALGLYLKEISDPNSQHYDKTVNKPFNYDLAKTILYNIINRANNITDPVKRLAKKHELLNYFQNVVASSTGSNRYIVTSDKYYSNLNNLIVNNNTKGAIADFTAVINHSLNSIDMSHFSIVQHYNRVFYVKPDSDLQNKKHIYVATGRKVNVNSQLARQKAHQRVFNNSDVASNLLIQNGLNITKLNQDGKEAQITRLPSLPPEWDVIFVNDSLASLTETQADHLINSLNLDNYLELIATAFTHNWSNNVIYQKVYDRKLKAAYKN